MGWGAPATLGPTAAHSRMYTLVHTTSSAVMVWKDTSHKSLLTHRSRGLWSCGFGDQTSF